MPTFKHIFTGKCAAGDQFTYTWHVRSIRTIDVAHAAAIVWNDHLWNGATAGNGYKDHVTADVQTTQVKTVEINLADGKQLALRQTGQVIVGVAAGNAMPADVAMVVSARTAFPQRSGRGRLYLPQPAALNLTSLGRMTADFVNDINAALVDAWGGYNTSVDRPVIYSPTFHLTRDIVSFDIADLFGTQRRRENKLIPVRTGSNMP